jgi:hypothetical protein
VVSTGASFLLLRLRYNILPIFSPPKSRAINSFH